MVCFFYFSSALSTIQPHLLCDKLLNIDLCPSFIMNYEVSCVKTSLCQVKTFDIIANTGASQATVLSPYLYSLITSDCRAPRDMFCKLCVFGCVYKNVRMLVVNHLRGPWTVLPPLKKHLPLYYLTCSKLSCKFSPQQKCKSVILHRCKDTRHPHYLHFSY